ncbi:TRAM domain-containing protein [Desulfitobacterium sp.]|uniref:TRAM domain-containing protein n=1 Tax=Desulfitobacterium sp. TaxID=49981 RepID=UPI002B1E9DE3|nr:TRAM domain-containing protein [Desulfitobacterium sp.]MEA4902894.1 TRAM domain-containing protein [Desulfitobacterium sp.]
MLPKKVEKAGKAANENGINDGSLEIDCLRLSSDGSGVGYDQGKATFVPGLLPGERGKALITEKRNPGKGRN